LTISVGVPSTEASKLILRISEQQIEIENQYAFQSGHIYQVSEFHEGHDMTMNVSNLYGIRTHVIA
jgi:hypothetical protein